jgi:hypothetical protein
MIKKTLLIVALVAPAILAAAQGDLGKTEEQIGIEYGERVPFPEECCKPELGTDGKMHKLPEEFWIQYYRKHELAFSAHYNNNGVTDAIRYHAVGDLRFDEEYIQAALRANGLDADHNEKVHEFLTSPRFIRSTYWLDQYHYLSLEWVGSDGFSWQHDSPAGTPAIGGFEIGTLDSEAELKAFQKKVHEWYSLCRPTKQVR